MFTVTSEIGKLLNRFSFRPLDYYYEGPPPLIDTYIGLNFTRTSKEKQKVILQKRGKINKRIFFYFLRGNSDFLGLHFHNGKSPGEDYFGCLVDILFVNRFPFF